MSEQEFSCQCCGNCCVSILRMTPFGQLGMFLKPQEIDLFPSDTIEPMYRYGDKVIVYQMIREPCPNYVDKLCAVYPRRPQACRAYPAEMLPGLIIMNTECPSADHAMPTRDMANTSHDLLRFIMRLFKQGKMESYDRRTDSWKLL